MQSQGLSRESNHSDTSLMVSKYSEITVGFLACLKNHVLVYFFYWLKMHI